MAETNTVAAIDPEIVAQLYASAPSEETLTVVLETFQALADPTRLKILYALRQHEVSVRDLSLLVGVSESAVSHQLRFLRERHLVHAQRRGNSMYYMLSDHHLPVLMREAEYHVDHVQHDVPRHHR